MGQQEISQNKAIGIMIRVISIDQIEPYAIICSLSNGIKRKVEVKPLIENHLHLDGISSLLHRPEFMKAEIGEMGEIRWKNVIKNSDGESWDYDISPEFILHEGLPVG
ncbi:MAG: hypothetical protein ACKOYP_13870 [Bacteroidota bacterium]